MRSAALMSRRQKHGEEAGAVAVVVALMLGTVFIAVAAVAIDLGSMWSSQRSLVTDTDAAALAAARTLSEMPLARCEQQRIAAGNRTGVVFDEAETILTTNTATDELIEVEIRCDQRAGKVSVSARQPAIRAFAGFMGVEDSSVYGRSIAEWTRPAFNPIPLAVCDEQLAGIDAPPTKPGVIVAYKDSNVDNDCLDWSTVTTGSTKYAPGNWGWLEFEDLFDGDQFVGGNCEREDTGLWCPGDPGNNTSNQENLFGSLKESQDQFQFVLFDFTRDPNRPDQPASGRNADFRVTAVVDAVLRACANAERDLPDGRDQDCRGNPSFIVMDVIEIREFADGRPPTRRADLALCGDRATDRCSNQQPF